MSALVIPGYQKIRSAYLFVVIRPLNAEEVPNENDALFFLILNDL